MTVTSLIFITYIVILLCYRYVFSTEGHLLPATPQISLVREHCMYFGAFCKSGNKQDSHTSDVTNQETNETRLYGSWDPSGLALDPTLFNTSPTSGFIKVRLHLSFKGFLSVTYQKVFHFHLSAYIFHFYFFQILFPCYITELISKS